MLNLLHERFNWISIKKIVKQLSNNSQRIFFFIEMWARYFKQVLRKLMLDGLDSLYYKLLNSIYDRYIWLTITWLNPNNKYKGKIEQIPHCHGKTNEIRCAKITPFNQHSTRNGKLNGLVCDSIRYYFRIASYSQ